MWIMTTTGFYSVVQKPGEEELCVRARTGADLDRLREHYLPSLGATQKGGGTDYPYRARVGRAELAVAMVDIVRDVTYANFKSRVAEEMGSARAHVYGSVWSALHAIEDDVAVPQADAGSAPSGKTPCYGGVLVRDGEVLLRRPTNDYDGYVWTFAKGKPKRGEPPEQTALREVRSETGVEAEVVGVLPGWYESGLSATRFYVMEVVAEHGDWDTRETGSVRWVPLRGAEARELIERTTNGKGRARDLAVLEALRQYTESRTRSPRSQ